ncbi:MAG: Alpha/beta hydrolase family protein [Pelotomaculum sp. PtaU1.Bin035]|nr:MAG: Alpha/beta hydrolase family protein [Pelotomaculum sp. PtaU1.Bin035]
MVFMRKNIEFSSVGLKCRGWLYTPEENAAARPTIVMAHGISLSKEMGLEQYAEKFCREGFAVLVFDYRYLGESDGEPRGRIIPEEQVEDYRNAISYARTLKEVDPDHIGIWGTSYSGGHCLQVAAFDKRVKCVVSQVPVVDCWEIAKRFLRTDILRATFQQLIQYRESRYNGGPEAYLPVVGPPGEPCFLASAASYEFFTDAASKVSNWKNQMTLESMEKFLEYVPGRVIDRISPTPLRMIVARQDEEAQTDLALKAYEKALEPKSVIIIAGGHFDAYTNCFDQSSKAAIEWFKEHLL